jgi:hypothetical protein
MERKGLKTVTGGAARAQLRPGSVLYEPRTGVIVTVSDVRRGGIVGVCGEMILRPLAERMQVLAPTDDAA